MKDVTQQEKSKTPLWVNMIILVGILLILWQTLVEGSGTMADYIAETIGRIAMTILVTFVVGLIPYLILKKRKQKAKLIIFSISFLLISIVTLLGTFYRNSKQSADNLKIDLPKTEKDSQYFK